MRNTGMITPASIADESTTTIENNLNSFGFVAGIYAMMTDPRFINGMCEDPTGNLIDMSGKGHDGVPVGSWTSADRIKHARGWVLNYNGSNAYFNFGDHDDFSIGNGENDSPRTFINLIKVNSLTGNNTIFAKQDNGAANQEEYFYQINGGYQRIVFVDNSVSQYANRIADVQITLGWHLLVLTYDGVGGATCMDGVTFYQDGLVSASTPTNRATYVAMENSTEPFLIGTYRQPSPADFFDGSLGLAGMDGAEWSASDVWQLWQRILAQYSTNGVNLL